MNIMVTGSCGQLGYDVMQKLSNGIYNVIGTDIKEKSCFKNYIKMDITNFLEVKNVLDYIKPDIIIHCAAWTAVDLAEDEDNKDKVYNLNVNGTKNLVSYCAKSNCKFVYISTDYVFEGRGELPWEPDNKEYSPINYYGFTKLEGEKIVSKLLNKYFIIRIAWVFGLNGNNFVKTMISLANKGIKELRVVDDQIGTPTYTYDLAQLLADMIQTDKYGYYHATNEGGFISWADFAEEIFKQTNQEVLIKRVSTEEYGISSARRPLNSRLDKKKLIEKGFNPLPEWKDALRRFLIEIGEI